MSSQPTLFPAENEESPRNTHGSPGRAWLGVVSAEHARYAARHGWIQLNNGDRRNLARMSRGDGFVYYSPTERMGDRAKLRSFTALGVIADDEPHLADEVMDMGAKGTLRPWRRAIEFEDVHAVDLRTVTGGLVLTQQPNWGYGLRFGLVSLAIEDFELLRATMTR
ncbi:EVE domain-containing protein [Streptomyces sp. NPDC046909]|uniref:EVE domain-containing protein n=1 Tax=Streptomyces sp. NPDC046909 TaxID=3155617 RepID=UPI00340DB10B